MKQQCPASCPLIKNNDEGFYLENYRAGDSFSIDKSELNSIIFVLKGKLAINGMSDYLRDSGISNSALVVSVTPKDYGEDLFDGVRFQRELEEKAYKIGNGKIPVQKYIDFKNNKLSTSLDFINTKGEYESSNLNDLLPIFITDSIHEAMPYFKKQISCFDEGVLLGIESRTSSPITILRDENGESNIKGIYPVGEGAGYSGGITTSAMDALKQVENFVKIFKPFN